MTEISYRRHRFRRRSSSMRSGSIALTLSHRDVEELLAARGLDISYETVRCRVLKFEFSVTSASRISACGTTRPRWSPAS
jgi:transposase-like protein